MRRLIGAFVALVLILGLTASGCAPNEQETQETDGTQTDTETTTPPPVEDEADSLYNRLQSDDYETWATAPRYGEPQQAQGPHGERVQIRLNKIAEAALAEGEAEWPDGSVVAKDIWVGEELVNVAAMEKREDAWYFGEWNAEGDVVAEGEAIEPCQSCHQGPSDGTLGVSLGR